MNKLFTEDLPWKITSLVLAFLLWIFVINTQNPTQPQEISGIKIQITGLEELEKQGYELKNKEEILTQNFKVVVNGPRLETDKLVSNPQLITATLNLNDYANNLVQDSISDNATYRVMINTDVYNVTIKDKKPQVTKILIDKIDSKEQKIIAEISKDITDTYTLLGDGKPVITPEKIKITGPKSEIDRVSEAKVIIEAKDFSEDKLVNELKIHLFDADGIEIEGLEMSTDVVQVKLPIGSEKKVPVKVNFTGELPEGYVLINTIVSPSEVTIIGRAESLEKIDEIQLVAIDKATITQTDLRQVDMILREGVMTLIDNKVSVSLEVMEELTLAYTIQSSELNLTVKELGSDLAYEILSPSIEVTLSALPNTLLLYSEAEIKNVIKATIDLTGYTEGEYTLPLTMTVPDDTRIVNEPINLNIRIKVLETEETTPPPDEEQESTDNMEPSIKPEATDEIVEG